MYNPEFRLLQIRLHCLLNYRSKEHWSELKLMFSRAADGCVIVAVAVVVQPAASVTVTVYVPAVSPVAVAAVPPEGAHEYV